MRPPKESPPEAKASDKHPDAAPADAHAAGTRHVAEVAHAVHGRVRLRIPAAAQNQALLSQLKTLIEQIQGIDSIDIRTSSNSLVVYYDSDHHPEVSSLLGCLNQMQAAPVAVSPRAPPNRVDELTRNIEQEATFLAEHSTLAKSVVGAVKQLDKDIKRTTNNNIDLKIMVPVALAGVTFLEIGAAAATPMWITLAIFSLNHFVELHAHDADEQ